MGDEVAEVAYVPGVDIARTVRAGALRQTTDECGDFDQDPEARQEKIRIRY